MTPAIELGESNSIVFVSDILSVATYRSEHPGKSALYSRVLKSDQHFSPAITPYFTSWTLKLYNVVSDEHGMGILWKARPLIVIDAYEHAFYIDYQNRKAEYVEKFMEHIDWVRRIDDSDLLTSKPVMWSGVNVSWPDFADATCYLVIPGSRRLFRPFAEATIQ